MTESTYNLWLDDELRRPIEAAVSSHVGAPWRAEGVRDLSDLASHPCAILTATGAPDVFVKLGSEVDAAQRFEVEASSLGYLAARAGVRVPTVIGIVSTTAGTAFVMRALKPVQRGPREWWQIGKTLAQLHRVTADRCGFHMDNYFGSVPQDNTPVADWPTFYGEYRLRPRLRMCVEAGHVPPPVAAQVESVIDRLPALCGPTVTSVLLHGDAQRNNFVSTREGAYAVDPAIHYGHPELDLAYVDLWQPVPDEVLDAYAEELPIDPGFAARQGLWRLSGYLAAVADAGPAYVGMLVEALAPYV